MNNNIRRANLITQINQLAQESDELVTDINVPEYAKNMIRQLDAIIQVAAQLLQVAEQQVQRTFPPAG